jgi:uncharacterized protein
MANWQEVELHGPEFLKIHLQNPESARHLIRAYQPAAITVGEEIYTRSLVVSPERLVTDWPPSRFVDLNAEHIEVLLTLSPELILIGTGLSQRFPSPGILQSVVRMGIGYEIMDTGAACRTYNVLAGEGRNVVAGLIVEP